MKFYPVPKFPCDPAELAEFRELLNIPRNLVLFPNRNLVNNIQPNEGDSFKPWKDTQAVWRDDNVLAHYYINPVALPYILTYREYGADGGGTVPDVGGLGQLDTNYSPKAVAFYVKRIMSARGGEFTKVPRIWLKYSSRADARNLNLTLPMTIPAAIWPIGTPTMGDNSPSTINPEVAFRFNPNTGWPEAFLIDEYDKEFPLSVPTPAPTLTDSELVGEVKDILALGMSVAKTAEAIRKASR